jgi:hypothetical protein
MIVEWGIPISDVKFLAILASAEGLKNVTNDFPDLEVRSHSLIIKPPLAILIHILSPL